jgi:Xaa-Pro aminopeptidase
MKDPPSSKFLGKKLKLVRKKMEEEEIDLWLIFTREGQPDPVAKDFGLGSVTWRSAGLFGVDGTSVALVGNLDTESVRRSGIYDKVYGYGKEGASSKLAELVAKSKSRKKTRIAIDTSDDFGIADGLSTGMRRYLRKSVRDKEFVSSEDIIISFRSELIPEEIEIMKTSIAKCEEIFRITEQDFIRIGRTDKEIHDMMQAEVLEMGLGLAWSKDHCPSVTIGGDEFGHMGYSNTTLKSDQIVHLDFGVKYQGYCSDLQRFYYVGGAVPSSVKDLFKATRDATTAGIEALKVGVKGYVVDGVCRGSVTSSGYPEYIHGTGHPIARETHEIGPSLAPRWRGRYGRSMEKKLRAGTIFTIEPSVKGKDCTCNIEQEVILTVNGAKTLSTPEEYLYEI